MSSTNLSYLADQLNEVLYWLLTYEAELGRYDNESMDELCDALRTVRNLLLTLPNPTTQSPVC